MALPAPQPGLVIRYAYLWRSEAAAGREEAVKDRPCAIVLATKREGDKTIVVVAPITHSQPRSAASGVELPAAVKARLGLDTQRSWVVTDDLNYFTWPGPDLRPVSGARSMRFVYGQLPKALTDVIIAHVREQLKESVSTLTGRDETASSQKR